MKDYKRSQSSAVNLDQRCSSPLPMLVKMEWCMCCQVSFALHHSDQYYNPRVSFYTGDDFYVPEPHLADDHIRFTGTTEEMHLRSNRLHRYVFDSPAHFILNFPNLNGHLSPLKLPTEPQHKL